MSDFNKYGATQLTYKRHDRKDVPLGWKWCYICGEVKKLDEFPKVVKRKYGKRFMIPEKDCKECRNAAQQSRRQSDAQKARVSDRDSSVPDRGDGGSDGREAYWQSTGLVEDF